MANPEACGVWMEQRIQEELDRQDETGHSLREIGRIVSAEVVKMFETKVSPGTVFQKTRRIAADTNVSPTETPEITDASGGGTGGLFPADPVVEIPIPPVDPPAEVPKKTAAELVPDVSEEVAKGTPVREATRKVAEKYGKKPETLRKAYKKEISPSKPKQELPVEEIVSEPQAEKQTDQTLFSHAMQFAIMAISQLKRIKKNDPNKEMAFNKVKKFLNQNS